MPAVFQVKRDFVRVLTANVQPKNIMCHRPGELLRLREVKGDGLGSWGWLKDNREQLQVICNR